MIRDIKIPEKVFYPASLRYVRFVLAKTRELLA